MKRIISTLFALLLSLGIGIPAFGAATTINVNFTDTTGADAATKALRETVFNQAVADWEAALWVPPLKTVTLTIDVEFKVLPKGKGGATSMFMADAMGLPKSVTMMISTNTDVFYDATLGTAGDIPADKKDAYSVARHEIGHAMGFAHNPPGYLKWNACVAGAAFDCNGATATLAGGAGDANGQSHVDETAHAGDLMNLTVGLGNRRGISGLDKSMLSAAFGYLLVDLPPHAVWDSIWDQRGDSGGDIHWSEGIWTRDGIPMPECTTFSGGVDTSSPPDQHISDHQLCPAWPNDWHWDVIINDVTCYIWVRWTGDLQSMPTLTVLIPDISSEFSLTIDLENDTYKITAGNDPAGAGPLIAGPAPWSGYPGNLPAGIGTVPNVSRKAETATGIPTLSGAGFALLALLLGALLLVSVRRNRQTRST